MIGQDRPGKSPRPCPFLIQVPQGTHRVFFDYALTGDKTSGTVTIGNGQHVTTRADFTGSTPQVHSH